MRDFTIEGGFDAWGYIPNMISDDDRTLKQMVHDGYSHGGGWRDFEGFEIRRTSQGKYILSYPGDPEYHERGRIERSSTGEKLVIFPYSWVLWIKGDEQSIARID